MINPLINTRVRRIASRTLALLLTALAAGAFFNSASPLGFPLVKTAAKAPAAEGTPPGRDSGVQPNAAQAAAPEPAANGGAPAQPVPAPKGPVQSSGTYSNEPLNVQVMPGGAAPAAPPAAPATGGPYSNETLGARVVRAPSDPRQEQAPVPAPEAATPEQQPGKGVYGGETIGSRVVPVTPPATPPAKHPEAERPANAAGEPVAVTWVEAKQMLQTGEAVLVDARPLAAFQAGSIPGAISLPFDRIKEEMPEFMKRVGTGRWLIVYCSDQGCASSEQVAKTLIREYGYQHVFHMPGGYAEWQIAETGRKTDEKKQ